MPFPFTDPVLIFASVMLLILVAPLFARRLHLPEIVGLIAAGMIVGPFGFGILERDQTIELLGTVGLLFIMFLAGLEIDLNQVRRNKSHTVIFGFLTFLIPLTLGTALGYYVFEMSIGAAVLLASMFSSHTLLTFPVIGKLGLAKHPAVTTTIGGTIITDTLALLLLAVIASATRGEISTAFWIQLFSLMVVYLLSIMLLLPIIGRWFFRKFNTDENTEFVFVIALTFLSAYLAHVAGLEPIIGAFLAGLTFNSLIPEKSLLMTRIHFSGDAIFIPFFLISVGMLVNVRLLEGASAWIVSLGMIFAALITKYLAALLSGFILKYRRDESVLIFGLSVNQAAATLAAVLVGYNIGLFDETIITGTIIMIAVTCLVGSVFTEKAGRTVALHQEQAEYESQPSAHRIMLPLKDRKEPKELDDIVFMLREKGSNEPVYPVSIVQERADSEVQVAYAEKVLANTVVRAMASGIPVIPLTIVDISMSTGLLRSIKDHRVTMVIMGWDGHVSSKTRIFGRNIDPVIERSTQMIMINRITEPINTTKRIVVVLPPLAHRQRGFNEFVNTIKTLANQAGTSLLFLTTENTYNSVSEFLKNSRPAVQVHFEKFETWKRIEKTVGDILQPLDWLFLMSARKGEIAWQPTLDRMPGKLANTFSNYTFSVIFTPTEKRTASKIEQDSTFVKSVFRPQRMLFNMNTSSLNEMVFKLLQNEFRNDKALHNRLTSILCKIGREEPVELLQDVLLLHTYVPYLSETITFLGVSKKPLDVPLASGSPHIVIVLLDPVGQDPANHLRALSDIANLIRLPSIVDILKEVKDYGQLVEKTNQINEKHSEDEPM
ncbi:Na+/H+ antiporter [Chitinispirillum alkaliphilum]|nr:Na+/H+ antiporter [Chitinispirillum alkaliphilum]